MAETQAISCADIDTLADAVIEAVTGTFDEGWQPRDAKDAVKRALEAAVSSAPLVPSPAYGDVKALEWVGTEKGGRVEYWSAATGLHQDATYEVWKQGDGIFKAAFDGVPVKSGCASPDEAKAAAQADFERRVLSCLSPVAMEDPGEVAKLRADVDRLSGLVLKSSHDVATFWNPRCAELRARSEHLETALRRSQRALIALPDTSLEVADCISANRAVLAAAPLVAVEEADAKAGSRDDYVLVPREPTEAMIDAADRVRPLPPHYLADAYRAMLAAAPSTPSPQIGNAGAGPVKCPQCDFGIGGHEPGCVASECAGAGPVGEAVAWRELVSMRIEALEDGDQFGAKKFAIAELRSILDHATRPVEEPGEVERDEAPQTDGGFLTKGERAAIDKLGEATALRRELAEARGLIRDATGLVPLAHQNWHTDARTALGDAQEAGR